MPPKSSKSATEAAKSPDTRHFSDEFLPEPKYKVINIHIENYKNIKPFFPVAEVLTTINHDDKIIGNTTSLPVLDDDLIPVNQKFSLTINVNNPKELDALVSIPLIFIVSQVQGTIDSSLYSQIQLTKPLQNIPLTKSFDSVISIYEAFTGRKTEISEEARNSKNKRNKSAKGSEKSKVEKNSKKSQNESKTSSEKSSTTKSKSSSQVKLDKTKSGVNYDPTQFGICCLDLLPLFYGPSKFTQMLWIKPTVQYNDNKMLSFKAHPTIVVTISMEEDLDLHDSTFLNFTLETIYNIPALMSPEMDFWACIMLPMLNGRKSPLLFTNPATVSTTQEPISKLWPGTTRGYNDANATVYTTPEDHKDLISRFDTNYESYITEESPRLQFVMIKRHLMFRDAVTELINHIQVFKKVVLEIYVAPKEKTKKESSNLLSKSLEFVRKIRKGGDSLHLMAILDVATLTYPGVQQVRLAAPLTTFSPEEAAKYGGLDDSFFFPYSKRDSKEPKDKEPRENLPKKDNKSVKSSKSSKAKAKEGHHMKDLLPPKPAPAAEPESSMQVYNEAGKPCFVVVTFEMSNPLVPAKKVEDVKEDLSMLLKEKTKNANLHPTSMLSKCMSFDYYNELLNAMILDLNDKFLTFTNENPVESLSRKESSQKIAGRFVDFLKHEGIYESYVHSITKATSLMISKNFQRVDGKDIKEYQKFIGNVFVFLISKMNKTVNELVCHELKPVTTYKKIDNFFFYAKEAMDTNRKEIAEKYFLERICNDPQSADYWFDYGIYLLERKEDDKSYECMKESLLQKQEHKYSLIVLAALLSNKGHKEDAETCFLNIVTENSEWCEGWAIFYLFYQKTENYGGMDNTLRMAKKYSDVSVPLDYFSEYEDLVWTSEICPKTVFFRTAMLLLKLRLFSNYAVSSLAGHCFLALGRKEEAEKQYYYALESFNRPVYLHLVTVNLAQVLIDKGADQKARNLMLLACKYNPSPYTWYIAGKLYYEQKDFLSAEECFSEANAMDNTYAEIWGYLALVNFKLQRQHEADQCLNHAIKNKLSDEDILEVIKDEYSLHNHMYSI
ncbi:cilia- and flagella-associated protein 70-like isoform X2 [Diabrotica undecimpunctata]|uniref:cilia- and flagella-associated protein 70-like isoform X2 n=1 Tax=Diabrotica undecimpunctata TaxID=50387 RepID=UPI003B63AE44